MMKERYTYRRRQKLKPHVLCKKWKGGLEENWFQRKDLLILLVFYILTAKYVAMEQCVMNWISLFPELMGQLY